MPRIVPGRVTNRDILLATHFAPVDLDAYHAPPWVHETDRDPAVRALREFTSGPRIEEISDEHAWLGRIRTQVLPVIESGLRAVA